MQQSKFELAFSIHRFDLMCITDFGLESDEFLSVSQNLSGRESDGLKVNVFGQFVAQQSVTSAESC